MSEKIKVVVKRVGQPPFIEEIGSDFHAMRDIVGGAIGMTLIEGIPRATITYNDTGLLDNLPPNITWGDGFIAGNIVIAGNRYGETVSLTPEQIEQAMKFVIENDIGSFADDSKNLALVPITIISGKEAGHEGLTYISVKLSDLVSAEDVFDATVKKPYPKKDKDMEM